MHTVGIMMQRTVLWTVLPAMLTLILAGCGSGEPSTSPQASAQSSSGDRQSNQNSDAQTGPETVGSNANASPTTEPPNQANESDPDTATDANGKNEKSDAPSLANVDTIAGEAAFAEGDYTLAIEHLTKAIEKEPSAHRHYYRGVAYEMTDEPEKAVADLSECIKLQPNHSRALYSRSLTYRGLEKWDEAFADIRRAYEIDSEDFRVANAYAQMLAESPVEAHHDGPLAVKVATKACELTGYEDPICVQTLSAAYATAGNDAKAQEYAKKAAELEAGNYDYDFDYVRDEIKEYFEYHMEQAAGDKGLQEIVPGKVRVAVWTIDRDDKDQPNLIFTTGMSELPMSVGADSDENPFAEVCIYLPPDWPTEPDLEDQTKSWPWLWLRRVAHYPHEESTFIGQYPSVFPPQGPLEPLFPESKFKALLLVPGFGGLRGFPSDEGIYVSVITAIPIYEEEYKLAQQEGGLVKLFQRFDEIGLSPTIDLDRKNVAVEE